MWHLCCCVCSLCVSTRSLCMSLLTCLMLVLRICEIVVSSSLLCFSHESGKDSNQLFVHNCLCPNMDISSVTLFILLYIGITCIYSRSYYCICGIYSMYIIHITRGAYFIRILLGEIFCRIFLQFYTVVKLFDIALCKEILWHPG